MYISVFFSRFFSDQAAQPDYINALLLILLIFATFHHEADVL